MNVFLRSDPHPFFGSVSESACPRRLIPCNRSAQRGKRMRVPPTTDIGLLSNSFRQDSEWRRPRSFNRHSALILTENLRMQ